MPTNLQLHGVSLSPGLVLGSAYVFRDILDEPVSCRRVNETQVNAEWARVKKAIDSVSRDLEQAGKRFARVVDPVTAEIFQAHAQILQEDSVREKLHRELANSRNNAECAVQVVFRKWAQRMDEVDDDVLRERAADFQDLGRRLLRRLLGIERHSLENIPTGRVLVADTLLPSDTIFFPERNVIGFVTVKGGAGSHCALLARQMGIPGVCRIPRLLDLVRNDDQLAVDGVKGDVFLKPDQTRVRRFQAAIKVYRESYREAEERCHEPALTTSGQRVPVCANIGVSVDSIRAAEHGADGVGLFRSEVLFQTSVHMPTEDELQLKMEAVLEPLKELPVAIRLLDIGGDKGLSYFKLPAEDDPFLGVRGVRLLLQHRELLRLQLRAILKIRHSGLLQIIVPMVTFAEEMLTVREELVSVARAAKVSKIPQLGAMVETPAAALGARDLAAVSDFLNIGTNDLTQYTMAAGRENSSVAAYFRHDHDIIFDLITMICRQAASIPVGVCGELAGEWHAVPRLLDAGVSILSVAPPLVPTIKQAVRKTRVRREPPGNSS